MTAATIYTPTALAREARLLAQGCADYRPGPVTWDIRVGYTATSLVVTYQTGGRPATASQAL